MKMYEVLEYLASLHYSKKEEWEQARVIAFMIAQVNSSKKLKMKEVIPLPWDESEKEEISVEEVKRLTSKAKELENKLNGGLSNKTTAK